MSPKAAPEAFFLPVGTGARFCLYHPPATIERGTVLYVHPFAEEMNRARRMAALQSRALAQCGYGVLQLDLHGCGDSSDDFADARWETWLDDLAAGSAWLAQRSAAPLTLWGMRLGAALALDFTRQTMGGRHAPTALVLWQPVLAGRAYLNSLLRLRLAGDMLAGAGSASTADLRADMERGATLEIGGYELHSRLGAAIDTLDGERLAPGAMPVHWLEIAAASDRPLAPAAQATAAAWRAGGTLLRLHQVTGPAFWNLQESPDCRALIEATLDTLQETSDAV